MHDGGMTDTPTPIPPDAETRDAGPGHGEERARTAPIRVAKRLVHVRRAFGEPIERDGVTLVPVARVMGGSGFGGGDGQWAEAGTEEVRTGSGSGGGFGVGVTPLGVYVVRGADVRWEPALDINRAVCGGLLLAAFLFAVLGRALRRRLPPGARCCRRRR